MKTLSYIRIGARATLLLGVVGFLFIGFLTRTNALGTTFATGSGTGGLEMQIDSHSIYNNVVQPQLSWVLKHLIPWCDFFFNFTDIKPGDTGENTISVHIKKSAAWVCLDFLNLKDTDNGNNKPESKVDADGAAGGELSKGIEFFAWRDDGDNVFEVGEKPLFGTTTQAASDVLKGKSYALADSAHGPAWNPNSTHYVGITWCAGNLMVDVGTAAITCDGATLGNGAQTDSMAVDVSLRAVQSSGQSSFVCNQDTKHEDEHDDHGDRDSHDKKDKKGHDDDDNEHNDSYSTPWREHTAGDSFKDFCVNTWNKIRKNSHS